MRYLDRARSSPLWKVFGFLAFLSLVVELSHSLFGVVGEDLIIQILGDGFWLRGIQIDRLNSRCFFLAGYLQVVKNVAHELPHASFISDACGKHASPNVMCLIRKEIFC